MEIQALDKSEADSANGGGKTDTISLFFVPRHLFTFVLSVFIY